MKKKVLSVVLVISIITCLFSGLTFTVNAAVPSSDSCGTNATYTYSNGVLTISGTGKIKSYSAFGDVSPFAHSEDIKKIVVKSGITSLGKFCFYYCKNVTEISLPNTLTEIQNGAFCDCENLTTITIPNSVTYVGWMNFVNCKNMETIYYMGTKSEFAKVDLDEDWSKFNIIYHDHSYNSTVTPATLTKDGKTVKECAACGKTITTVNYCPKTFTLSTSTYKYTGAVRTPSVTVKNSKGNALKKGTDYTVSYPSGRKNVGQYSVTVNFKGNYSGKKTLKFKIEPKISFSSAKLCVNATKNINAKSSNKITYKSSNSKVATVNSKGVITAKKKGATTITLTSNKISKTIKVTVSNPYIKLDKTNLSVMKGKSTSLKATVCPSNAKVTWSSGNKSIAKVSSSGKVTGVKIGTTTIKATIKYKGKTYQKTCKVTVIKPSVIVKLPAVPKKVSDSSSTVKITSLTYKIEDDDIVLIVGGEKTYDTHGNYYSDDLYISYKLYDSAGYVVADGSILTPSLKVGDKFRNRKETIYFWDDLPVDIYTLEIINTDNVWDGTY